MLARRELPANARRSPPVYTAWLELPARWLFEPQMTERVRAVARHYEEVTLPPYSFCHLLGIRAFFTPRSGHVGQRAAAFGFAACAPGAGFKTREVMTRR